MSTPSNRRVTRSHEKRLPHTHSGSFRRKSSRGPASETRRPGARKSLKFDIDNDVFREDNNNEPNRSKRSPEVKFDFNFLRQSQLQSSSVSQSESSQTISATCTSQLPGSSITDAPNPNFWDSPFQAPLSTVTVHRRSMRLKKFAISQITNSSKLEQPEPTSDLLSRSKIIPSGFDQGQTSDYGSDNSYFRPSSQCCLSGTNYNRDKLLINTNNTNIGNKFSQGSEQSHSVGYNSDLDEVLSNLSIEDVVGSNCSKHDTSKRWESDEDDKTDSQNGERKEVGNGGNGSHLGLGDLYLKDIQASFKTFQGISVLMPSNLLQIGERNVVTICNKRYHFRKDPCQIPDKLLTIQTFEHFNLDDYFLNEGIRLIRVSPVISIEPHDVQFNPLLPATIQIPLQVLPSSGDEVHCLFNRSSIKDLEADLSKIRWESVEAGRFSINDGKVCFETFHFGLFVLVIRPSPIVSTKTIKANSGGRLQNRDNPTIEIKFPETLDNDINNAQAKVYFDTEDSVGEFLIKRNEWLEAQYHQNQMEVDVGSELITSSCLATPILQLEPHGMIFPKKPVLVTLPIPDYDKIMNITNNTAQFKLWQSNTHSREARYWERLNVECDIHQILINGNLETVVTFPVSHFSFFKGVWESISNVLHEAKVGMLYYFVSFAMKCQANMEEYSDQASGTATSASVSKDKNEDDDEEEDQEQQKSLAGGARFGLEVIVFQADKPCPQISTYKYKVGQSQPKLVKPGKVTVRLKSNMFEPDIQAGEEEDMVKEEADFRGRDFEKQFILKFKPDVKIERGAFGKVKVTRCISSRQNPQPVFEFNIQKHGNEADVAPTDQSEIWSIVALRELANNLFVTDGENWKQFANEVGMTKQEIKAERLKYDSDPFQKIVNHYRQRGGTPEELVNLLYRCNRAIKVSGHQSQQSPQSNQTKSSNGSSGRGSLSSNNANFDRFGSHDSDTSGKTSGTRTSQDSGLPPGRKRSHHTFSNRGSGSGSLHSSKLANKRRRNSDSLPGPSRRQESSDADEEAESDSSFDKIPPMSFPNPRSIISEDDISQHLNDRTKLTTQFMWKISDHIQNTTSWRALGRTLGLEESVLIDIDHNYARNCSLRECAYQMLLAWQQRFPKKCTYGTLYKALKTEGMSSAAKFMSEINMDDD